MGGLMGGIGGFFLGGLIGSLLFPRDAFDPSKAM